MQDLIDWLQHIQPLSAKAQQALLRHCAVLKLSKGEILQSIGRTCYTVYFIRKGSARIFYYKDGNDITESFAFENSLLARVESLFTGRPSLKGIELLEDTELIAISALPVFKLYDEFPQIERLARKITERGYVDTVNRIESLQFHSAEERYRQLLLEAPDLLKRVPLKHIASYLGITQVSLSRIRRKAQPAII